MKDHIKKANFMVVDYCIIMFNSIQTSKDNIDMMDNLNWGKNKDLAKSNIWQVDIMKDHLRIIRNMGMEN
jgi:hypothetical protein